MRQKEINFFDFKPMQTNDNLTFIISRTDSIGDVMHTLPLCAWIKESFPNCKLLFLGRTYTQPILDCFEAVDTFIDYNKIEKLSQLEQISAFQDLNATHILHVFPNKRIAQLAKKAKIKNRIGTSHRIFHWFTCTSRPSFTRKGSVSHEAQLNFELLKPLGLQSIPSLKLLNKATTLFHPKCGNIENLELNTLLKKDFVILHPKSQGSAVEWPIENYLALCKQLISNKMIVVFTGTETEGELFRAKLPNDELCFDATGKCTLQELILLISKCKALVACSTGPLHLAGFQNRKAIGLFAPRIPIHPGRWAALGVNSKMLVFDKNCKACANKEKCTCVSKILPSTVFDEIVN